MKKLLNVYLLLFVCCIAAKSFGQSTALSGGEVRTLNIGPGIINASPAISNPVATFSLSQTSSNGDLTQVKFTTSGTYSSATDITDFALYVNTTANSISGSSLITSVAATGAGVQTINLSTSYTLTTSVPTYYFFIVPTFASSPVSGHTIAVSSIASGDITVSGSSVSGSSAATGTLTIANPSITGTTPGSRCGTGTVSLGATASSGASISWFDVLSGGSNIGSGSPFTTPSISTTTPYYAEAAQSVTIHTGTLSDNTTYLAGPYYIDQRTDLHWFSSTNACTINSVDIYPAAAGNIVITMTDASGVILASATPITISSGQVSNTVPVTVPLGFSVPAGATNYRLGGDGTFTLTQAVYRGAGNSAYGPYPTGVNGFSHVGDAGGNSTATGVSGPFSGYGARCYFYNWNITLMAQSTSRATVSASVNPVATGVTATASPTGACVGGNIALNGTATGATGYSWAGPGGTAISSPSSISTGVSGAVLGNAGVYTLTATLGTCSVTATTTAVTVNPLPVPTYTASPGANTCVGSSVTYATLAGQSSYTWSVAGASGTDYTITGGGTGSGSNNVTLTWLTTGSKTVTANYTNTTGCPGTTPATNTTTVNARPVPTFVTLPGANTCVASSSTYTTQTGMTSYVWAVSGVSGTDYTIAGSGTSSVTVTWLTAGSKTVSVNYTNGNGCTGASSASTVTTVNALPVPTFATAPTANTCNGADVTYTTQASQSSYVWSLPGASGVDYTITGGGTGSNTVTLHYSTNGAKTATVNYTDGNGCTGASAAANTTTVNALPSLFIVSGGGPYCAGSPSPWDVRLTASTGGVNYQLRLNGSAAGMPSLSGTGGMLNYGIQSAAGTYTVLATGATGCTRVMVGSAVITINPLPVPTFTVAPGVNTCAGADVTYTTEASMANYLWLVPGLSGTDYMITGGGTGTGSNSVTLRWLTGGSKTVTVNYQNSTTGCAGASAASNTTNVNVAVPTFTSVPAATTCQGANVTYTTQSGMSAYVWNVPGVAGTDYIIASGGTGNGSNTVTLAWMNTGIATATVNYTDGNGCTGLSPAAASTSVIAAPIPTFTSSAGANTCTGNSVMYTTQGSQFSYNWNITGIAGTDYTITGGGTGSNTVTLTWLTAGSKTVTVNYANGTGCVGVSPASNTTMVGLPVPTFTSAPGINSCLNGSVTYTTQTSETNYTWSVPGASGTDYTITAGGTGSADNTVTLTWLTTGSKTVTINYTDVNGCTGANPTPNTTMVNDLPVPAFTDGPGANSCENADITYTTQADETLYTWSIPGTAGTDYSITSGGTGGDNTVTLMWLNTGSKTVMVNYIDTHGCTAVSAVSNTTNVNPRPVPTFTTYPDANICANGSATYTTQEDESGYNWNVPGIAATDYIITAGGTGSADNTVTLTWLTPGSKTVTVNYTDATGCQGLSSATNTTLVNPTPDPIAGTLQACTGLTSALSDLTPAGSWSSSDAGVASIDGGGIVTGVTAGTVIITYAPPGCIATASFTVNPLPEDVEGATKVCAGLTTGLSDINVGGTWSSSAPSIATVGIVTGVAGGVTAGMVNITYTLPTGCITTAQLSVNPIPNTYAVVGGGSYCSGDVGVHVQLGGSASGVSYQLYVSGLPTGSPIVSTGGVIDFGLQTTAGIYTVVATDPSTTCTRNMSGSAVVGTLPLPTLDTVTGGGQYCAGSTGLPVGLSGSTSGVRYQLYRDWAATGIPFAGTGGILGFGIRTLGGNYTVVATNTTTGCKDTMAGSATIIVNTPPAIYAVTGGGSYCDGSGGVPIGLTGSDRGIEYQLYHDITRIGSPLGGSGDPLDYGLFTLAETYHVIAKDMTTGCTSNMLDTVTVVTNPLPIAHAVIGGGNYCESGIGVHVGLDGSNIGISYQLNNDAGAVGGPAGGAAGPLDFGLQTVPGVYYVVATDIITGCTNSMPGTATVGIIPVVTPSVSISGSTLSCYGNSVTLSGVGVNEGTAPVYSWRVNGTFAFAGNSFTYRPADGDAVMVTLTSSAPCATPAMVSNSVTLTVLPTGVPTISIAPTNTGLVICQGTAVNFAAATSFAGSGPSYVWMVNGAVTSTGSSGSYTYVPANHDNISCIMTSNYVCRIHDTASSNHVNMAVDANVTPVVNITASPALTIAKGQTLTLTATVTNGGPSPFYQWYVNGTGVGGANTSAFTTNGFADGDSVSCSVLTSGGCPISLVSNFARIHVTGVGVPQFSAANGNIKLMPNPNKGSFSLHGTLAAANDEDVSVVITNMLGQVVYNSTFTAHGGKVDEQITTNGSLANGMYLLNLRSGEQTDVFHFVMEQ